MKTSLTLVATALFSLLAAAAPITDNFGDVLVRNDEDPESQEIGNVFHEKLLFKRENSFKFQQEELAKRVKLAVDSRKGWLRNSFDAGLWETVREEYEEALLEFEAEASDLASDNFNIESDLRALKNLQTTMTETGKKLRSFKNCKYPGQELLQEMMVLSVELLAFKDNDGNVDVSDADVKRNFEDRKSKFISLQGKAKKDEVMIPGVRRLFDEYAEKAKKGFNTLLDVEDSTEECPAL